MSTSMHAYMYMYDICDVVCHHEKAASFEALQ